MLDALRLRNALISGANNIVKNKEHINELNVFPVPDGDTGTNMSMTISSAVKEVNKLAEDCTIGDVIKTFSSSLLRSARGNSGVILSIIFRGFSKLFSNTVSEINGSDIVNALELGVKGAYEAVTKPTEGTMLTVARVAFEKGKEISKMNNDVVVVWNQICKGAYEALEKTPELLPVLKKAGVVDAGGKGLCLIFEGMLSVIRDNVIIDIKNEEISTESDDEFRNAAAEFDTDIRFTYCTEFIVRRSRLCKVDPQKLKLKLQKIGDCVVVVNDEEIIKVHVHTENPGKVLEEGLKYGQLITVKVENMKEQHRIAAEARREKLQKEAKEEIFERQDPIDEVGFVSVAAGEGICNLFKDIGCSNVISGGQTMNPSTDKLLEAILATPAKTVYIFPNNKNIILSAEQAVALVKDRTAIIIPTKTVAQGICAMLAFDFELDSQKNIENMTKAISRVKTGQVTFAARDSEFGGFKIRENDILGLSDGKLSLVEKDPVKAAFKLIKSMTDKTSEFITIIYGESISLMQAQLLKDMLDNHYKNSFEINLVDGKQPIYHFIISIE